MLGNQLTTPLVNVTGIGSLMEIKYTSEADDLQFDVFMANQLGHLNPRFVLYQRKIPVGINLTVSCHLVYSC